MTPREVKCATCPVVFTITHPRSRQRFCAACRRVREREQERAKVRRWHAKNHLSRAAVRRAQYNATPEYFRACARDAQGRKRGTPLGRVFMLLSKCRGRAKRKGLEHTATLDDLLPLPTICPVLGISIDYGPKADRQTPNSPSIDRIDNSRGYVPGNVRIISWRANDLRRNATAEELRLIADDAERIAQTFGLGATAKVA